MIPDVAAVALAQGLSATFDVVSTSMLPTIPPDSAVHVAPAMEEPRVGDLLVFRQSDYVVVHRFLGRARTTDGRPCLRTRGDGARSLDPPVDPSAVLGRVTALRRGGQWWSMDGSPARLYAWAVARHLLFWAAVLALFRSPRAPAQGAPSLLDRSLLFLADRTCFRLVHRRVPLPGGTG